MAWLVKYHAEFKAKLQLMSDSFKESLLKGIIVLEQRGPTLGRKWVDTVKGSRHTGMKELRFNADGGIWRVLFIFDQNRTAIILVAGNKKGKKSRQFYGDLIAEADDLYDDYLAK